MKDPQGNIPTILVILGVTGDLMSKKIAPALFDLHVKKLLPTKFQLVGVSRRDWGDNDLRKHVRDILAKRVPGAKASAINSFLGLAEYHKIRFDALGDYNALQTKLQAIDDQWGMCTNKLFYLSVPPEFYGEIFENLKKSHLADGCGPNEGWTRVIVEKPFGSDEKSAKALDAQLARLFKEEQVYRIDHYLAKETFQNVLAFRFFNNLFEDNWGKGLIEKINIRELENIGVEDRGAFYDKVGALRDVGQNHLLQMLALTTMDQPRSLSSAAVRESRAAILQTLKPLSKEQARRRTFQAQYEGYRSIKGVERNSKRETYFRVEGSLAHPNWEGVPIIMEAGKRLVPKGSGEITEIEVVFRHPKPCLCPPGKHYKNTLTFRQDPKESIVLRLWLKKEGFKMEVEERVFDFDLRKGDRKSQYTEEYEKLLLDCIAGDQTLFVSSEEIAAMWRFIDPILKAWHSGVPALAAYKPDSDEVSKRANSAEEEGGRIAFPPHKEIAVIGLGKMGRGVALQLREKGWRVLGYNRHPEVAEELRKDGIEAVSSLGAISSMLKKPRIFWIMITAGAGVDETIFGPSTGLGAGKGGLANHLGKGDIVIDSGNSLYEDSIRRAKKLAKMGVVFMDVGFSGGPKGARYGGSLMIGGDERTFKKIEGLFADLSVSDGYRHFGEAGAGHFVKMVHNGIEYGMMQALAEGFAVMKKSPFKLDLEKVAEIYNHGSVIESRLVGWLKNAYKQYGEELKEMSGSVAHTGEGEWTVKAANKFKVPAPIIKGSFDFRVKSKANPSYIGKILTALRNQFGGHNIK